MIDATKTITRARRKLGEPLINVELTDEQMTSLLKDAQETFYLYATMAGIDRNRQDTIEDAWIKKFFYALCKETLGRVRGKFDGKLSIPGTDGFTLDYESLLAESIREKCFLKYTIFGDKELLNCAKVENAILVFYISVGSLENRDVAEYVDNIQRKMTPPSGFTCYFLPVRNQESKIECIYPVSGELDEDGKHVINRLEDYLSELTKDNDEQD